MEWIIALIVMTIMPLGMILWWVPRQTDDIPFGRAADL